MGSIGKSLPRKDGLPKATGKAIFTADIHIPGMLYAKVKRSEYAHAKILKIDLDEALKVPGVVSIATAKDIPGNNVIPVVLRDMPLLADGFVRFFGEPIAVVA
ncbi:MAG: xanthine dehydrogenase family protein molybdopterin-binding subunit, partial [bacterium]